MWGCGQNQFSELGFDDGDDRQLLQRVAGAEIFGAGGVRMVSCEISSTMILSELGQIWACGRHHTPTPTLLPNTDDFNNAGFVCITSGTDCSGMLTEDGHLAVVDMADGAQVLQMNHLVVAEGDIIGRWHHMQPDEQSRAQAFVQGTHSRLGSHSDYLMAPAETLQMVWQFLRFRPSPYAGTALRNLMGFGPR
jgi:hypothetical protein